MNHYQIRLNTGLVAREEIWKIIENGVVLEKRAYDVRISVPSYTEETLEDYPDSLGRYHKYNIACDGYGAFEGNIFVISGK